MRTAGICSYLTKESVVGTLHQAIEEAASFRGGQARRVSILSHPQLFAQEATQLTKQLGGEGITSRGAMSRGLILMRSPLGLAAEEGINEKVD